jgi:hypothetical protein
VSAQVLQEPSPIDWREIIAGKDAVPRDEDAQCLRPRRELGLGKAILIAAGIEILAGIVVALILAWQHPHRHAQSSAAPLHVHLVATASHSSRASAQGARYRNPSVGRAGGRTRSAKAHVSGGKAGVPTAASANTGLEISRAAAQGRRQGSEHIRLNADCASTQEGCLNARELRRYLQRLHVLLQQRLSALVRRDLPLGSGPVVLRFVGNPAGGEPNRVDVFEAPTGSDAGRQLRLTLQGMALPPYPAGLGDRRLSFKVALHSGGH